MKTKQPQRKLYRLLHVKFNTIEVAYDDYESHPEYFAMQPFKIPENMSPSDALLVISYINEKVNRENRFPKGSQRGISITNKLLKRYSFECVDGVESKDGVEDLITTSGLAQYRDTDAINCREKFLAWYNPDVARNRVFEIYKKCGLNLDQIEKSEKVAER